MRGALLVGLAAWAAAASTPATAAGVGPADAVAPAGGPVAAAGPANGGRTTIVDDPSCGAMRVAMQAGTVVYTLPHGFLRAGGDSVTVAGDTWHAGTDYILDRLRGELRLLRAPAPGETLVVHACWLLEPPPREYHLLRYRPVSATAPESAAAPAPSTMRPLARRDPGRTPEGASLAISGNKSIAVDFGSNQDAFLRQSLDLAVSGTLAPEVQLTGVLSDRNTPLTEAGSTQSLQSLDRVRLELTAPAGSAALGDVTFANRQGEFARVERRLQGMKGTWRAGFAETQVAAAASPGVYHRLQFFGEDGRQGPYLLTDRDGGGGISVVAESERVTVDGEPMTRGEGADYTIDYDRARITFTLRRPVSSAQRIAVEYQYTVTRFRRNLIAAGTRIARGSAYVFVQGLSENDDRGRPVGIALDAGDRIALSAAGDSARAAVHGGITAGGGDYDSVRVAPGVVAYAFAGSDSGTFAVEFARLGPGLGDYADSTIVGGRTIYRYVGAGAGAFVVGRALPLPEARALWSVGGGVRAGPVGIEAEGAISTLDRNTFSRRDDGDNQGFAGRLAARSEGRAPWRDGVVGLALDARSIEPRFSPFTRLERPYEEEDWGLAPGADLDHQRRAGVTGYARAPLGTLTAGLGRLRTPDGFTAVRRTAALRSTGVWQTDFTWLASDGEDARRLHPDGRRDRVAGLVRWRGRWLQPAIRGETDTRRFPSDSAAAGFRQRETGVELASGSAVPWVLSTALAWRRDGRAAGDGFEDLTEARTWRVAAESPAGRRWESALGFQRRDVLPIGAPTRTRSDLGFLRIRADDLGHGFGGQTQLELSADGENRRVREVRFVGVGQGGYDALGNFVGTGDYDVVVVVSPEIERLSRAATSAQLAWRFGTTDAWRGSRVAFDFEGEARRRGSLSVHDPFIAPGAALDAAGLVRASVLQRLEGDLAPGSRAAAVRLRLERRVTGDRAFENFAQTRDERTASARWRARPASAVTAEVEARLARQEAVQALDGANTLGRIVRAHGGTGTLVVTPGPRLRAAAVVEVTWQRLEDGGETARTVRLGPDLGVAVGARGRAEVSVRRAFVTGEAVNLVPVAGPVAPPVWDANGRYDMRVKDGANLGISLSVQDREGRPAQVLGRAEVRAFF